MILRLAVLIVAVWFAGAAFAGCPAAGFAAGQCAAEDFGQADGTMAEDLTQLDAILPAKDQDKLHSAQIVFLHQRERSCEKGSFIDFGCAARLTQARLAVLKTLLGAPATVRVYNGRYTVPGTAMPFAAAGTKPDGTGAVVLTLQGLKAQPGQILIIRYVSGEVSLGPGMPAQDANGLHGWGALMGAFTDPAEQLVGPAFVLGDGPDQVIIPARAAQFQLGIKDNAYADNTGSLMVAVQVSPAMTMLPAAKGVHGCAVFGAKLAGCQSFPGWVTGWFVPPAGTGTFHVLAVGGGGGGGSANFLAGVGGSGGGSGEVVNARIPIPDGPIEVRVGVQGAGGPQTLPGLGGTGSVFGPVLAHGGWGGQLQAGGSALGNGGHNGGGGGGGGTYEGNFDAGAGGTGGTGGSAGAIGAQPIDVQDGVQAALGGGGAAFPLFDFSPVTVSAAPGGAGGALGSGGVNAVGDECAGGGGGGGGGGGVLLDNTGPAAKAAGYVLLPYHCGQQGGNGLGGIGYGAGGGGVGDGTGGPGGDGNGGVVLVAW
jgi:hypothetical protein